MMIKTIDTRFTNFAMPCISLYGHFALIAEVIESNLIKVLSCRMGIFLLIIELMLYSIWQLLFMLTISVFDDLIFPEEIVGSHFLFINSLHSKSRIGQSQGYEAID